MKRYHVEIDGWTWERKEKVRTWLKETFGSTNRWGEYFDYGLEDIWMDEDVFMMYRLRWE
jgi:hypothetical protein